MAASYDDMGRGLGKYGITAESLSLSPKITKKKVPYTRLVSNRWGLLLFESLKIGKPTEAMLQDARSAISSEQPPETSSVKFETRPGPLYKRIE